MPCAGLESACGCSKHRLVYERALLLGHAREQLLPLPVALLCCLCGLVLPEVFLQVHKSMLRFVHSTLCCYQQPCDVSGSEQDIFSHIQEGLYDT